MADNTVQVPGGRHVDIGDTQLFVVERGSGYPLMVFHGGPGLDHTMFGDYLDPLTDRFRLILVDERGQGRSGPSDPETWSLKQMAEDVGLLANALGLDEYAVLGHSYGAFVVLQHAADFPGQAAQTIVSSGIPSERFLEHVAQNLETFEPADLREQVASSWERETTVASSEELGSLLKDQMPFHFADPLDARIEAFNRRTAGGVYSPEVLRHFSAQGYGGINVEERLGDITQPTLVLAGRHDRTCSVAAAEVIAKGVPNARLMVFEHSGHMTFVEENEKYLDAVRGFLLSEDGFIAHDKA